MIEENLVRLRARRNNILRYRRLLATRLSDLERTLPAPRAGTSTQHYREGHHV